MKTCIIDAEALTLKVIEYPNYYRDDIQKIVPSEAWVKLVEKKLEEKKKIDEKWNKELDYLYDQAEWFKQR